MILAEKIMQLRKKNGWSQEELAEQVHVSRQSVSKWESGSSIPDLNKILLLAQIFEVSTDYLLKDEIGEEEQALPVERSTDVTIIEENTVKVHSVSLDEAVSFMADSVKAAKKMALGVLLCILSPVCMILLAGYAEAGRIPLAEDAAGGIGVFLMIMFVVPAVALFILTGMKMERYQYLEKEVIELEYGVSGIVKEKKQAYTERYSLGIIIGVILCIVCILPLIIAGGFGAEDVVLINCLALMFLIVSAGVYIMVRVLTVRGSYDKLLQECDYTIRKKVRNKRNSRWAPVYWCLVTAVYLGYSLVTENWHRSWIIWPVAGVIYGAVWAFIGEEEEK